MPSKSRRSRRNIPQARGVNDIPGTGNSTTVAASTNTVQSSPSAPTYQKAQKAAEETAQIYTSFSRDIKWIAVVTGIIVILLIVAYYVVPH
jgi:hypothetical protein